MNKHLIIDGNSLGHYANNGGKLMLGAMEVTAIYNFLRTLRQHMALYQHHKPVVLWDGASWRKMMFNDYKDNRDKAETKAEIKQQERKAAYKAQVPHIKKALRFLGIPQLWALNMEADDLGAILTDRYTAAGGQVVLLTGDQDWLQLVSPKVVWRDFANKRIVRQDNFAEMTGVPTVEQFVQVKALAGDTGDGVPGVGGVGKKGAIEFLNTYGSFNDFLNMVLIEKSVDWKKLPKKFKALVEDEEKALAFERNLGLVDLRTPARPAPQNMQLDKGEPDLEKFARFCEILLFKSILQELEDWARVFPAFHNVTEGA